MTHAAQVRDEPFEFTADRMGSEILERFSKDIYNPKAIIRELVSNAYDSYYQLEEYLTSVHQDADITHTVKVSLTENAVVVSDDGLGMDRDGIDDLVSIALTNKREIAGVRGYRGIGFWSAYTGGETVVVETTKLGNDRLYRLTLNTKRMRQLQSPSISISKIMNDPECVHLESEPIDKETHGTKVIVVAESNEGRLHTLVSNPDQMEQVLLQSCSCRLAATDNLPEATKNFYSVIEGFYQNNRIKPAILMFQTGEITKEIPSGLGSLESHNFEVDQGSTKVVLAKAWFATNVKNARLDTSIAGIRVFRDGFPIGKPNIYSERALIGCDIEIKRDDLLDWHIGEVHLLHEELRPDASGEAIPDTFIFLKFREQLRTFYNKLIGISFAKQRIVTLRTDYRKMQDKLATVAQKLSQGEPVSEVDVTEVAKIALQVEKDGNLAKGMLPANTPPGDRKATVRDEEVGKRRRQILKTIKQIKEVGAFSEPNTKEKPAKKKTAQNGQTTATTTSAGEPVSKASFLAVIEEVRDAVMEVLSDEPTLQQELITRINDIVAKA